MASNCKSFKLEIEESVGGTWFSREARAHLDACPACFDFFESRDSLRRLVGELERVEAPGDFDFRLRARMVAASNARGRRFSVTRFAPGFGSVALASFFALSVTAAFYFNRSPVENQPPLLQTSSTFLPSNSDDRRQEKSAANVGNEITLEGSEINAIRKVDVVRAPQRRQRTITKRVVDHGHQVAGTAKGGVVDSAYSSAPVFKVPNVKLNFSAEPLRVVLRDESGVPRHLSMNPVSFGSQNLVGRARELSSAVPADDEGVW